MSEQREILDWADVGPATRELAEAINEDGFSSRRDPCHRARGPYRRSEPRLRARSEEHLDDERGVLYRRRRASRAANYSSARPGVRGSRGGEDPDRRRRRRHRRHAGARQGFLCSARWSDANCDALRKAALRGQMRLRLATDRPMDRVPLERRAVADAKGIHIGSRAIGKQSSHQRIVLVPWSIACGP